MGKLREQAIYLSDNGQQPALLKDLKDANVDVFCWCNRCDHNIHFSTKLLIYQLGTNFPVPEIGTRMRCKLCGSKDIATRPAWPTKGQITRHD